MKSFMHKLSTYEHHEIFTFPHIYFVGQNAKKKQGVPGGAQNCGYDDDQGSYLLVAHDHIQYRYEVIKIIGFYFIEDNEDNLTSKLRQGQLRPSDQGIWSQNAATRSFKNRAQRKTLP